MLRYHLQSFEELTSFKAHKSQENWKPLRFQGTYVRCRTRVSPRLFERRWQWWFKRQIKWVYCLNWVPPGSPINTPGSCCPGRRVGAAGTWGHGGGGGRCPIPVLPSNNQKAPLGAGTAPQPLHFIWLRKLPPPFLSSISISLSWAWTIFWDKMHVLLPSALPEAQIAPAAQPSNLGGRNQFQHLSFEHQTCGLAQSCVFTPS